MTIEKDVKLAFCVGVVVSNMTMCIMLLMFAFIDAYRPTNPPTPAPILPSSTRVYEVLRVPQPVVVPEDKNIEF